MEIKASEIVDNNFDYVLDNNGGLQSVVNTLHNIIETECKIR